jgi:hypothetical protein
MGSMESEQSHRFGLSIVPQINDGHGWEADFPESLRKDLREARQILDSSNDMHTIIQRIGAYCSRVAQIKTDLENGKYSE